MLRGEVNPGGVAVAKASPNRALLSPGEVVLVERFWDGRP